MPNHHTTLEGDGFCVPEMNVFWCEMNINPKTKAKHLVQVLAEAGKRVKGVLFQHGLKGHSVRKKTLLKKQHHKARLQMHTGKETLISGDVSCGLMKLKLNCLAIMTIVYILEENREA